MNNEHINLFYTFLSPPQTSLMHMLGSLLTWRYTLDFLWLILYGALFPLDLQPPGLPNVDLERLKQAGYCQHSAQLPSAPSNHHLPLLSVNIKLHQLCSSQVYEFQSISAVQCTVIADSIFTVFSLSLWCCFHMVMFSFAQKNNFHCVYRQKNEGEPHKTAACSSHHMRRVEFFF